MSGGGAEAAKANCPVSKPLAGAEIGLEDRLVRAVAKRAVGRIRRDPEVERHR